MKTNHGTFTAEDGLFSLVQFTPFVDAKRKISFFIPGEQIPDLSNWHNSNEYVTFFLCNYTACTNFKLNCVRIQRPKDPGSTYSADYDFIGVLSKDIIETPLQLGASSQAKLKYTAPIFSNLKTFYTYTFLKRNLNLEIVYTFANKFNIFTKKWEDSALDVDLFKAFRRRAGKTKKEKFVFETKEGIVDAITKTQFQSIVRSCVNLQPSGYNPESAIIGYQSRLEYDLIQAGADKDVVSITSNL